MRARDRQLPIRRIFNHEIKLAVQVKRRTQADGVENEVRLDSLGVGPATADILTLRKRGPKTWQHSKIAFNRDNFNRQTRPFQQRTADERRG